METYRAKEVKVAGDCLIANVNGREYRWPFSKISPLLEQATDDQRRDLRLASSGYGIHWPQLDEDISIGGLMRNLKTTNHESTI